MQAVQPLRTPLGNLGGHNHRLTAQSSGAKSIRSPFAALADRADLSALLPADIERALLSQVQLPAFASLYSSLAARRC